jgi:hypothetical protein
MGSEVEGKGLMRSNQSLQADAEYVRLSTALDSSEVPVLDFASGGCW